MGAVRTEGLRKVFGDVRALDGLTLAVEPGTVFGFLGPNGAGKTTTLRILTGLIHPSAGRAWVTEVEIPAGRREVAARIGYLPEDPAFYPWLTPREFLIYVGQTFGLPLTTCRTRSDDLLERMGLREVAARRIGGFSRGMRQRLGLAQALINRPAVLFLDEPASALDPAGRKEVLGLIESLRGECTVVMSTHILADVERVCDTVGIIAQGKLVAQAPRVELLERYATPAFEVECDNGQQPLLQHWAEGLRGRPWVSTVVVEGSTARVLVSDLALAKGALLASTMQAGLVLLRYEMMRPSLEDVFLRLVGEGGQG